MSANCTEFTMLGIHNVDAVQEKISFGQGLFGHVSLHIEVWQLSWFDISIGNWWTTIFSVCC